MSIPFQLISNVEKAVIGKPGVVRLAVACLLAEGHLLIDDIPGVGKTTLAVALSKSIGGTFQRIQFTSDLLPSDVLGVSVFNPKDQEFHFKRGPIFHHVVLADEVNRASPKTQSALLESMQERQVSMDGQTILLPSPFFVIATQNPHDQYGTFPLPESQLDRFLMRLNLGYPDAKAEMEILKSDAVHSRTDSLAAVTTADQISAEIGKTRKVTVDESIDAYIIQIAQATRTAPYVDLGLSPRGTLALRRAAQAFAFVSGRDFVIPDDVKAVASSVVAHRLRPKGAYLNGNTPRTSEGIVHEILAQISVPV